MKWVTGLWILSLLSTGVVAQSVSREDLRGSRIGQVSFHAVADEQARGVDKMTGPDGETLFVSRKPIVTSSGLSGVQLLGSDTTNLVELKLADSVANPLDVVRQMGQRVVVLSAGRVLAVAGVRPGTSERTVRLSIADKGRTDRVVRAIGRTMKRSPEGLSFEVDQTVGKPGDKFIVDVYVGPVAGVRGYQVALDVTGGSSGQLILEDVFFDAGKSNYIFDGTQSYNAANKQAARSVNALPAGTIDRSGRSYLVTYVYRAADNAKGDFHISFRTGQETMLLRTDRSLIPVDMSAQATISIR